MVPSTRLAVALAVAGMLVVSLPGVGQDNNNGLPPETLAQSVPLFAFQSQGNRPALVFTRSGTAQEQDQRVFVSARISPMSAFSRRWASAAVTGVVPVASPQPDLPSRQFSQSTSTPS